MNDEGRKLRSKVANPKSNLFNFENINGLLYRDEEIAVMKNTCFDKLYHYMGTETELPQVHGARDIRIIPEIMPRRTKNRHRDALADSVYEGFHKKMKKEEKVMTNEERLRVHSEIDNYRSQYELLHQYDWVRHLPEITHINDVKDPEELEYKRDLTIEEIRKLLSKHENWKKRLEIINNDIKEYQNEESQEESDEYTASHETLRSRRRRRIGPCIRLKLHNGYVLVIDPLEPPRIIKSDIRKTGLKNGHVKRSVTKLEDVPPGMNLKYTFDEDTAFGTDLSQIAPLPEGFKPPRFCKERIRRINRE